MKPLHATSNIATLTIAIVLLVRLPLAAADTTKLPTIFSDHMVLQRGDTSPVWGWAEPGREITVDFAGQSLSTRADGEGHWQVDLKDLEANATGASLTVSDGGDDDGMIELTDVLVGDVWLASGQSNMAMTVVKTEGGDEAIRTSADPLLRCLIVKPERVSPMQPLDDCKGAWQVAGPQTVGPVTAAGYHFARRLREHMEVPIGLIHSAWGGTLAEQWTSREALESNAQTRPLWEPFAASVASFDPATATPPQVVAELMADWRERNKEARANKTRIPRLPKIVASPVTKRYSPCNQFNTMIHPLIPFGIRGVVWYQGEGNRARAEQYETLLPVMIADWRTRWERPAMPFYIVQLANISKPAEQPVDSEWAELQWAQFQVARKDPHSGLAVINDGTDITLHPREKKKIGERLALLALAKDYGRDELAFSGPLYRDHQVEGDTIRIDFDRAEGLKSSDGEPLRRFQIAGADRQWHWAEAHIEGDRVFVSSTDVALPVAARYAWMGNPEGANLTNTSGIPASLFKTDDWPGLSHGRLIPQ